jgi:carbamoyltransferase
MKILGISAYYHDSAAALVDDGRIVAAAQEERFSRKKHDAGFPRNAVAYCLREGGVRLAQIDRVVFYDKPWIKFERMLETYMGFAPKGLKSFLTSTYLIPSSAVSCRNSTSGSWGLATRFRDSRA